MAIKIKHLVKNLLKHLLRMLKFDIRPISTRIHYSPLPNRSLDIANMLRRTQLVYIKNVGLLETEDDLKHDRSS
jgi:hypothetical protein